ncbi:hypothetical protein [Arthrobacter sp. H5]|uniref:glycosyltransferase family 87 protein n=1 Tax=Arthrobacter sp. H5 TaxID=1267973 RepID=UPI000481DC74|nr:hypothetical protein [Arthrobacter sp. H5]
MESEHRARRPVRISVPSRTDPLLRRFTESVGGRLGRRTSPGNVSPGFFTVERVLILLTVASALLAVLIKTPCRVTGWAAPVQFYMACFSDWTEVFQFEGVGRGLFPFLSDGSTFEGPVLLGVLVGIIALTVPVGESAFVPAENVTWFFDVNATLAAVVWIVIVIATLRLANRRPWDAAMVAVAPIVILSGTAGWELWPVMFGMLGMLSFARCRYVSAGILLGVGAGLSVFPALLFGAIVLIALRAKSIRPAVVTGVALVGTWLAVNLPFALNGYNPWQYITPSAHGGDSSIWSAYNLMAERAGLAPISSGATTVAAAVTFAALVILIGLLVQKAPRRPRIMHVALLLVAAFILVVPGFQPHQVLWLVPIVALAYSGWSMFIVWQIVEVMHWWAYWMYRARESSGGVAENNLDAPYYVLSILAHMAVTAYIMYLVAGHVLRPRTDPVRRLGIDDPAGGPYNGAPDGPQRAPVRLSQPAPPLKDLS